MGMLRGVRRAVLLGAGLTAGALFWAARRTNEQPGGRSVRPGAPRVLILGAGFGGITTALELGKQVQAGLDADILLVDRGNFHLFTPMLYQVATGLVEPGNVAYPARRIARDYGFRFRQGNVQAVDLDQRMVTVDGEQLPYDRLVLALGSITNYFGNASIEQHAASLKTLGDAMAIRNRVLGAFERAELERDVAARKSLLTFVVVGGGATGIELVGSLHSMIEHGLLSSYPGVNPAEVRVVLAEAGPKLLNGMDPWLGETAAHRLEDKGIELRLGGLATEVTEDGIHFKDGSFIGSKTVVWAAGVRPSPLTAALDVERGRDGRLVVTPELRLPAYPEAYALGDCAWFPVPQENGRPAPPNAQTAVRQAPVVANNLAASLRGAPQDLYLYANEGNLVALGQGDGVACVGPAKLEGFPAWITWRGFYLSQLMGFKNRLSVLLDWTSAYLGHRSTARLDLGVSAPGTPPAQSTPEHSTAPAAAPAATTQPTPSSTPPAATSPRDSSPAGGEGPSGQASSGQASSGQASAGEDRTPQRDRRAAPTRKRGGRAAVSERNATESGQPDG